ncbi:MAG: hypothetical protein RJA09_1272 [Pseudomonadota bacterium]
MFEHLCHPNRIPPTHARVWRLCRRWWVALVCGLALSGLVWNAWADDSDDGGSAPGADSAGAGAGGAAADAAGGGDGGTGPGEVTGAWFYRPTWPLEQFVPDGLVAINPSPAALRTARTLLGAEVVETHLLPGLGLQLVRLRLWGVDAATAHEELALRHPGVFAFLHLYKTAQRGAASAERSQTAETAGCTGPLCGAKAQLGWPARSEGCGRRQKVGLVDTWVDTQVSVLARSVVQTKVFLEVQQTPAQDGHGTAVAGVLVGKELGGYQGLLPEAGLWVGVPFYALPSGQSAADVLGVVRAIDWLVQNGVRVIGMPLAGPANPVLAKAVEVAQRRGILVVAAAGNGGRLAPPAHPAALTGVLAVTAINRDNQAYRLANQGDYIGYAMPGVDVPTWAPGGQLQNRTGTSYAVPFMVAAVSQSLHERRLSAVQWQMGVDVPVRDLGVTGRDPVYGWGVPGLDWRCL